MGRGGGGGFLSKFCVANFLALDNDKKNCGERELFSDLIFFGKNCNFFSPKRGEKGGGGLMAGNSSKFIFWKSIHFGQDRLPLQVQ